MIGIALFSIVSMFILSQFYRGLNLATCVNFAYLVVFFLVYRDFALCMTALLFTFAFHIHSDISYF